MQNGYIKTICYYQETHFHFKGPSWFCQIYLECPLSSYSYLSHIPSFSSFSTSYHTSKSVETVKIKGKENQHFYEHNCRERVFDFCVSFYYSSVHLQQWHLFMNLPPFLNYKLLRSKVCVFTYPPLQYQAQGQIHNMCSENVCWIYRCCYCFSIVCLWH